MIYALIFLHKCITQREVLSKSPMFDFNKEDTGGAEYLILQQ